MPFDKFTHKADYCVKKGTFVGGVENFSLSIKESKGSQTAAGGAVIPHFPMLSGRKERDESLAFTFPLNPPLGKGDLVVACRCKQR